MTIQTLGLATVLMLLVGSACSKKSDTGAEGENTESADMEVSQKTAVDYRSIPFQTITDNTTSLADFDGQVVLLVNVASKCGYTPQYTDLEKLYRSFKDSGFVVIGFPANNFGGQEPGTNAEIIEFCKKTYDISFPIMAKVSVAGDDKHPLFVELTENSSVQGEIKWNFSKMLLDRQGNLISRYDSGVEPLSEKLVGEIRKLL
ncbi:MAG: glutathione peroxidase [candidate division Zixibacteria bacterium]|nr:glutathione peroxidase [candidate division Zixibacteria bacterium]MDH4035850.1 glutathione peroxidase [candidate division Zixibacteria bacterium]